MKSDRRIDDHEGARRRKRSALVRIIPIAATLLAGCGTLDDAPAAAGGRGLSSVGAGSGVGGGGGAGTAGSNAGGGSAGDAAGASGTAPLDGGDTDVKTASDAAA